MHRSLPGYEESSHYQDYLNMVNDIKSREPNKVIAMKETEYTTRLLMHGQDRNRHGKMFGGYLMREAFDISYIAASQLY